MFIKFNLFLLKMCDYIWLFIYVIDACPRSAALALLVLANVLMSEQGGRQKAKQKV